jgi:hypothetical protein
MALKRLQSFSSHLASEMDPELLQLPKFDELPAFQDFNGCAWGVWGADDQLGTVNLLTEKVVVRAAQEEIKCVQASSLKLGRILNFPRLGKAVSLNW